MVNNLKDQSEYLEDILQSKFSIPYICFLRVETSLLSDIESY